ncbi:MAG: PQQ-binding-like beta-propeller repeat protein [Gemmataceae bacterium]|nr:PQQ-binding-like beta-propeller repeat protein [Gemmata sp.]MDW8196123.1 PQQ-binding-like beta-propeller repeat protein [Gemmataceae bacterium]
MHIVRTLLGLLVVASSAVAAEPATWTQWRGPYRDGHVRGPAWPDKISGDALKLVWRVDKLGPSYSGPIVAADRIFTTQTVDKKMEVVTAYDRKTGKELWKTSWEGAITVPFFAAKNGSWIRSTPAFDGKTLFVAGMRDVLVALDGATGRELWRLDFVKECGTPPPDFGFVCSPLVDDTGVYVQAGGGVAKVDKKTGKILWQTLKDGGGMMGSAFSSPVVARLAGTDQLVVQTRTQLAGVERDSGKVLWSKEIPSFRGMNILTPLPFGDDGIFTSTYGGNTRLLQIKSAGGQYTTADAWTLKYEGNMSTPVVLEDHAYLLGKDKRLVCVDLKTGREAWRTEERFGDYWSLVANKDKILALDNRGILFLIKANSREFELLDKRQLDTNDTWAHLAVCGDEIVIRDLNGLTVWRWLSK